MTERIHRMLPCMYKPDKTCVMDCRNHGKNIYNLDRTTRLPDVISIMNHNGIDKPTIERLIHILRKLDDPHGLIDYDSTGTRGPMTPDLRKLGEQLADERKKWIEENSNKTNPDISCPVYEEHLKKM